MSIVSIECPECAWSMEIDKTDIGATIKCPKCKESFIAEEGDGGLYDMVQDAKPKVESWTPPPAPKSSSSKNKKSKQSVELPVEEEDNSMSDDQLNDLMSNMEKWAEE